MICTYCNFVENTVARSDRRSVALRELYFDSRSAAERRSLRATVFSTKLQ